MKMRNFIVGAVAALVTMVSCQEEKVDFGAPKINLDVEEMTFDAAGGEQALNVIATREWIAESDAEWVVLSHESGVASLDPQTITVTVLPNTGMDREVDINFTIGMASRTLTVKQAGPGGSTEDRIVYYNDFDKTKAEKENDSWKTYLDSFDGWKNAIGTGAANCGFSANGITARTNSGDGSAGKYSVYKGSGMNYLWFAKENHFAVTNITLDSGVSNYTLSFGTERYEYGVDDNTFRPEEFKVYISADAKKWVEVKYSFPGALQNGKWDLASTSFTVPAGTTSLSVYFTASVASVYALDDLKLAVADVEGTKIDFSNGVELGTGTSGGNQGGDVVGTPSGDGTEASPYNVAGITKKYNDSGVSDDIVYVAGVISEFKGDFPAKYNSADIYISDDGTTNGQFYIFHGKDFGGAEFSTGDLKLGDKVIFKGKIKEYNGDPQLSSGELVSLNGKTEGGNEGGGNNGGGSTGGDDTPTQPDSYPTSEPTLTPVTIAEFLAKPVSYNDWYQLTGKITQIEKATYGNIYIEDATGKAYIYGVTSKWIGAKNDQSFSSLNLNVGDVITIGTLRQAYNESPQGGGSWCAAWYISHEDGEAPAEDADEVITVEGVIKAFGLSETYNLPEGTPLNLSDNISVTYTKVNNSNSNLHYGDQGLRWYKGDILTFSSKKPIAKMEFVTYGGDKYAGPVTSDKGNMDSTGLIWTGSASEVTFTTTVQTRVSAIKVTYVK